LAKNLITDVSGVRVGHADDAKLGSGATVVLFDQPAVAAADLRGGGPGTRESALLDPAMTVERIDAIVLAGGSAFGLDAAGGVMEGLVAIGRGFRVRDVLVPIVPAAILFDLGFGGSPKIRPTADCGYKAAAAAANGPVQEGNVGAGAGATVGKSAGRPMKAGIGSAAIRLPNGLVVAALVAVNAVGDIIDPSSGQVIAGTRTEDGKHLADARKLLRAGIGREGRAGENTTIGVVATNAKLTKVEAQKMAQMAHDGYARAISPVHTPGDGDTIFSLATGTWTGDANYGTVGSLAAEAMADALDELDSADELSVGVIAGGRAALVGACCLSKRRLPVQRPQSRTPLRRCPEDSTCWQR
jgi:L-aminopeptidase/D-esterase-like protein